jgi:hypothetical protein
MLERLRQDLKTPELKCLLGVNTRFGDKARISEDMQRVIKAQQNIALSLAHCRYVDCDGATLANNAHFDSAGTLEVGKRFARCLQEMEKSAK